MSRLFFSTLLTVLFSCALMAQVEEENETLSRPASGQNLSENNNQNFDRRTSTVTPRSAASWTDNLRYGGNFALTFGSVTYIQVSPKIGYQIAPNWLGGVGVDYIYYAVSQGYYYNNSPGFKHTIYGGNVYTTYEPFDVNVIPMALQAEFELLKSPIFNYTSYTYDRNEWVPGLYLGGGLSQPAGVGRVYFLFLYNVLYDQKRSINAPYVFRAGFMF